MDRQRERADDKQLPTVCYYNDYGCVNDYVDGVHHDHKLADHNDNCPVDNNDDDYPHYYDIRGVYHHEYDGARHYYDHYDHNPT